MIRTRALAALAAAALLTSGCAVTTSTEPSLESPSPASTSSGTVVVPLDVVQQGPSTLVLVPVVVDGQGPYHFLLDTGASVSLVGTSLADELGLEDTGRTAQFGGIASSGEVRLVDVPAWTVGEGGAALSAGPVGVLDISLPDGTGTSSVEGLLGSDRLSAFGSVTIDYAAQELRLVPGGG